jgi:hypothetical protein
VPFVDELGSYGCDESTAADYLRATAHSALANGARATVVWCWQDISATDKPYALRPGERFVGLLDAHGRAKPAMAEFEAFARRASRGWAALRLPPPSIGVFVPERFRPAEASYLDAAAGWTTAAFYAYLLLKRAHLPFEFTRGPLAPYQLVVCPSMSHLSLADQEQLADYVRGGGTLYYSCGDYLHGFGGEELFGVRLRDFSLQAEDQARFRWHSRDYALRWSGHLPVVSAGTADVLATYPSGAPALTCHRLGRGRAFYLNAPFERQLDGAGRLENAAWEALYADLAREAGVRREIDCDAPGVELQVLTDSSSGARVLFAINHDPRPVRTRLVRGATAMDLALEAKGVRVMRWPAHHDRGSVSSRPRAEVTP